MAITVTFDPPLPSDDPATFNTKAFTLLGELNDWSTEANSLASTVNSDAASASSSASTATTKAGEAATSASNASTSASNASSSASAASTSASNASTSASNASTSATNANNSAIAAAASAASIDPSALPALRPSLLLDFARSRAVDGRITFTRASTATRTNANGLIETVASGAPRIDYDPVTLACKGLLVEESRTNLLTYSEAQDDAAWAKTVYTVTASAATAPDGTTTADLLDEATTASTERKSLSPAATITASGTYTGSVYIKAAGRGYAQIRLSNRNGTTSICYFTVNLSTLATVNSGTSGGTLSSVSAVSVGNGWVRVVVTGVLASDVTSASLAVYSHDGSSTTFVGVPGSGVYVWGAQLEAGTFATSYIPTTSAQVTRAADVASMTGANFSSWFRQDQGSFVLDARLVGQAASGAPAVLLATNAGVTDYFSIRQGASISGANAYAYTGGAATVDSTSTAFVAGQRKVFGLAYANNDVAFVADGSVVATDAACLFPTTNAQTELHINYGGSSSYHIARIAYYPQRLTSAELQATTL